MSAKLGYSSGVYVDVAPPVIIGAFVQYFFVEKYGLDPTWVGSLWAIFSLVKALSFFLVGALVDSTTVRFSTLYLFAAVPMTATFIAVWTPEVFVGHSHTLVWWFLVSVLCLHGVVYAIVFVVRSAAFNRFFSSDERKSIGGIQQLFVVIGIIAGIVLPPLLADDWRNPARMASSIGLSMAGVMLSCYVSLRSLEANHSDPPAKRKENNGKTNANAVSLRRIVGDSLDPIRTNASYRQLLFAWFVYQLGVSLLIATTPMYAQYVVTGTREPFVIPFLGVTLKTGEQIALAQLCGQLTTLVATPLWMSIGKGWASSRLWQVSNAVQAAVMGTEFLLMDGSFAMFAIFQMLNAASYTPMLFVPSLAIAEVAEADAAKHGTSRAGILQGIGQLVLIMSSLVQGLVTANVLTSSGYEASGEPSAQVIGAVKILYAGLPVASSLVSLALIQGFSAAGTKRTNVVHKKS